MTDSLDQREREINTLTDPLEQMHRRRDMAWEIAKLDSARAQRLSEHLRDQAITAGNTYFAGEAYRCLAQAYIFQGKYADALNTVDEAERQYHSIPDNSQDAVLFTLRAQAWFESGDMVGAAEAAATGLEIAEQGEQNNLVSSNLAILGSIATMKEEYHLAIDYFERCRTIYEARDFPRGIAKVNNNIAVSYHKMGQHDLAIEMYERALRIYESLEDTRGETYAYTNLGNIMLDLGRIGEAREYFQLNLLRSEAVNDPHRIARAVFGIAECAEKEGNYTGALPIYHHALSLTETCGSRHLMQSTHEKLALCYEALGDHASALKHYRHFHELYQEMQNEEAEKRIAQAQMRTQTRLVKAEAEVLRLQVRETQRQLEHVDRLTSMGKLAASIAHEINNPLQAIIGALALAEDHLNDSQQIRDYLSIAIQQIDRITRLTSQMRQLYHAAPGETTEVDLSEQVGLILILVQKMLEENQIHLETQLAKDLPTFNAAPVHIQQVILNIIVNAIEALSQRGTLVITTSFDQKRKLIVATCRDTGSGMSPEVRQKVFDPFFTTKANGSGLGMSIAYNIVREYRGDITIQSDKSGTIVTLSFPVMRKGI